MAGTLSTAEAYSQGWRPIRVFLAEVRHLTPRLNLERTFMLWRHVGVVPPSIRPLRGWLDGHRVVLWPPETKTFMEDALLLRSLVSMRGGPKRKKSLSMPHAGLLIALWAQGWDYRDDLIRESLLAAIARIAPTAPQEAQREHLLRVSALLAPSDYQAGGEEAAATSGEESSADPTFAEVAGAARIREQYTGARVARLSRISLTEIRRAVRAAHHENFQAVKEEAKWLLGLALLAKGKEVQSKGQSPQGSLKGLLFELLSALAVGMAYRMFQPLAFEDMPKNLGWFIGVRLAERRRENSPHLSVS